MALVVAGIIALLVGFAGLLGGGSRVRRALFFVSNVACAVWAVGIAWFLTADNEATLMLATKIYCAAAAIIAWSVVLLAYTFFGFRDNVGKLALLTAGPLVGVLAMIFIWPDSLIWSVSVQECRNTLQLNMLGYVAYSWYFAAYMVAAIGFLVVDLVRNAKDQGTRQQVKAVLVAYLLFIVIGACFNLILPWTGVFSLIWVGPLGVIAFAMILYWATMKYKLFDFRDVTIKGFAYIVVIVPIFILYSVFVEFLLGRIYQLDEVRFELYMLKFLAVMAVVIAVPIARRLSGFLHKAAKLEDYEVRDVLTKLNNTVATNHDMRRLLVKSARQIREALGVKSVSFVVAEVEGKNKIFGSPGMRFSSSEEGVMTEYMDRSVLRNVMVRYIADNEPIKEVLRRHALAVMMRIEFVGEMAQSQMAGYIVVGEKHEGRGFTDKDMEVLDKVADIMLLAIESEHYHQQVQSFNENLRKEVRAATRNLKESNRKLQRLDATKDEFINMASHQLRTPLTSIKGYVSMMLDGDAGSLTPTQRQFLNEVYYSSNKMVHIVNDFLDVSRLQTGKFLVNKTSVRLDQLVLGEVKNLEPVAKAAGLKIKCEIAEGEEFLMEIDELKVKQVVGNLLDNAIYYSKPETTITVRLREEDGKVIYEVEDKGIGVPKEEQKELFTKFYRASNARKQRPDGTGVGLFLARKVMTAMGGGMIFRSKEGVGSVFGFWLKR